MVQLLPALEAVMFDEGCLDRMQIIARCEPIDRGDGLSVVHHCKGQTRDDAVSFDQHRAGSALAVIATLFRTGQREVFSKASSNVVGESSVSE
jgi:hypothetical protein